MFVRLVRGTYRRKAFGTDQRAAYPSDAIVATRTPDSASPRIACRVRGWSTATIPSSR